MNRQELIELLDAVDEINEKIWEQVGNEGTCILSVKYASEWMTYIEWNGEIIWHSDNEEREWIEDGPSIEGSWEPWDKFLKRQINKVIEEVNKVKL